MTTTFKERVQAHPNYRQHGGTKKGWIGVDLDGTLAMYKDWVGPFDIGDPIIRMVERVKNWLAEGYEVRVMTARVGSTHENPYADGEHHDAIVKSIEDWTEKYIGVRLAVTNQKDYGMIELYDDRAVQVEENTGKLLGKSTRGLT